MPAPDSPTQNSMIPRLELPLLHHGKVRDVYDAGNGHILLVASDRISAFDVILPDTVPGKGEVLTQLSNFWFVRTTNIVDNHLTGLPISSVVQDPASAKSLERRAVVVKHVKRLPLEAVVRGYLIGSGWNDYQAKGELCGIRLPQGLRQAEALPQPLFTPSTKADVGAHDENISFQQVVDEIGPDLAQQVRDVSLRIYQQASDFALRRGIIIADTKFEFGVDDHGKLVLIDELLTPDSSRFWPRDSYQVDASPPSFDKQYVRDYLETLNWNKQPPAPLLPDEVIKATFQRYREAYEQLTGRAWSPAE